MCRLFPQYEEKRLTLDRVTTVPCNSCSFVNYIGEELSVFYHNINNPLTILSGNIQLLQLMSDSMDMSEDILKPITDIATVSARFEDDLQSIAELKEKIRAGMLQKDDI